MAKKKSNTPKANVASAMPDVAGELAKIAVEFRYHWKDVASEVLWALPLGDDRYELRNVPFYAYGMNWGDVVRAVQQPGDEHPVVERVEQASGHRTMRVFMDEGVAETRSVAMLETLEQFNATYERHSGGFIAIDIHPDGDVDGVFDQLDTWEAEGLLGFETCEQQVPDDFGSDPHDDNRT